MELELVLGDRRGRRRGVAVPVAPDTRVGHVRSALAVLAGEPAGPRACLYVGARPVADDLPLAAAGLVTGLTVGLGSSVVGAGTGVAEAGFAAARGGLELAVVGGLGAGAAVPLPPGARVRVGRDPACGLVLDDIEVSRSHAEVTGTDTGAELADAGSRNGVAWNGYQLDGTARLVPGDVVQLGETVLELRCPPVAEPLLADDPDRVGLVVNRPPRIASPARVPELTVPAEAQQPRAFRFPLAAVMLPLLLAGGLYLLMPRAGYFLVFLAVSPLMVLANLLGDRRSGRKDHRVTLRAYQAEIAALDERLTSLAAAEERAERAALPDPVTLVGMAGGPTRRLWERRPADPDFLRLRLGLLDRPARVVLRPATGTAAAGTGADMGRQPPTVRLVPAAVDLPAVGVLGVAGPRWSVLASARALLAQVGALHDPAAVGLVLLTGRDEAADWEWATWLPHTRPASADVAGKRLVATDAEQAEARLAELRRLVDERQQEQRSALRVGVPSGRRYVLVLDGARRLRGLRGLAELLRDGPAVGVYALCLDDEETSLPDECAATAVTGEAAATRLRLRQPGHDPVDGVLADGLAAPLADRLARALAPLRLLGGTEGGAGGLPDAVRYLDLVRSCSGGPGSGGPGGGVPTADAVRAGWAAQPGARSTAALLGVGPDGPVVVDLRRDGPHALVAGTSGSGKSELLQTLVTSLALGNAPDALTFVLVDYKGGSAFADCRDLPHCVGMVTDLDGHLVGRALASLSAELRRREAVLAAAGAKDIEDYWATTGGRLPRLVIVVDEFASLVEEVPEFVRGVVGIGMRGRSLGVHLVLATQRPAGVVTAELRANVNLRVCLRVTSAAESTDVVDAPDAARISTRHPGRAYLRTGHRELTPFQAARVGWPAASSGPERPSGPGAPAVAARTPVAVYRRVTDLGARAEPDRGGDGGDGGGPTDLGALVAAVRGAAEQLGVAAPASPWLPPLPDTVTVAELAAVPLGSPVAVRLGLADQPDRQAQDPFVLDLDRTGPLAVAGTVRSGRSTVLRTLAASLAEGASPADVQLYGLDCGNRALAGLVALPHCGAVVDGADTARVERLLTLLDTEIGRRQRLLGVGGYGSLAEHRAAVGPADRLPYLVLLLDRMEAFASRYAEVDAGRLVDQVEGLLRRGPAVGVLVVLSTDRTGFGHRVGSAVESRLVLRQADRDDYAAFGLRPAAVPGRMPGGRAVWVATGEEIQVALLAPAGGTAGVSGPSGGSEAAAVDGLAAGLRRRWDGLPTEALPRRVDPLPERITLAEANALRGIDEAPAGAAVCMVGVGGDHLAPVDVDLAEAGGSFVVAGPVGSGRSTALATVVATLRGRPSGRLPVLALAPRPSPLRELAGQPGVLTVLTDGPDLAADLDNELAAVAGPVALAVDDAELVADGPAAVRLERFVREARDCGSVLVAAGTTEDLLLSRYRGWLAAARRGRCGLLLNPQSHVDGEAFDLRLPRSTSGGWPPGRGLLVLRGSVAPIQVPDLSLPVTRQ